MVKSFAKVFMTTIFRVDSSAWQLGWVISSNIAFASNAAKAYVPSRYAGAIHLLYLIRQKVPVKIHAFLMHNVKNITL